MERTQEHESCILKVNLLCFKQGNQEAIGMMYKRKLDNNKILLGRHEKIYEKKIESFLYIMKSRIIR